MSHPFAEFVQLGDLVRVKLRGPIDETSQFPDLALSQSRTEIDLAEVRAINSIGIRVWISWLAKLPGHIVLLHAPVVFLQAAKIIPPVLTPRAELQSFQVATGCLDCGKIHAREVTQSPANAELYAALTGPFPACEHCGGEMDLELPREFYERLLNLKPALQRTGS